MWFHAKLFLLAVCVLAVKSKIPRSAEKRQNEVSIKEIGVTTMDRNDSTSTALLRSKRGWGSIIFYGTSVLLRTTSLGLSLAQAITEGCFYYPSICENKKEIEKLEKIIQTKSAQIEKEFMDNKKNYYNIRQASTNNAYINYYTHQVVQNVESLQEHIENITELLTIMLPKLYEMYEFSKYNSSKEYVRVAVGQLDFSLSDINKMLLEHKKMALIVIAAQYAIEAAVNKFISSLRSEVKVIISNNEFWEKFENPSATSEKARRKQLKYVPKALKQMITRKLFSKTWYPGKTRWQHYKEKMSTFFKKPIENIKNTRRFFADKNFRKYAVSRFKLGWTQKIMMGIGILGDIISQAVSAKQWGTVNAKIEESLKDYKKHDKKLDDEISKINIEKQTISELWKNVTEVFRNLTQPFKSLIQNASKYRDFEDVFGHPGLPKYTDSVLFSIDLNHLTKDNVKGKQEIVRSFLEKENNNLTQILDQMNARKILYNKTLSKSKENETVKEMLKDVTDIYKFNPSSTVQKYGKDLKMKSMVCTISILRPDIVEYDFYPLEPFRPRCEVNASTFMTYEREAAEKQKRNLMRIIVLRSVSQGKDESLSILTDAVHNAYLAVTDQTIGSFGRTLTDQDVICTVSTEFPDKQMYDFIELGKFRPLCSAVTASTFSKMKQDAEKLRSLTKGIKNDLNTCEQYNFCPCLSTVSTNYGTTEADVLAVIKHVKPSWQQSSSPGYCGPTGCGCKHL